jgi:sugar/nucleoside kinase (ribokinase family)
VLGGTATYAALTAARLGQRVGVLTSAGWEPELVDVLASEGVQVARLPAEHTTRFVNVYEHGTRRQFVEARAETLSAAQLPPEWGDAPLVHLAPLADELDLDLLEAFPRAIIGVTPQGWMRAWDESGLVRAIPWREVERVLARVDVAVFSEEDVPDPALIETYAGMARLAVVTRGQRGASIHQDGHWQHSAAFQAGRQVDPTGAGDVFAAGFLIHYRQTGDALASADFANCVASFAVEKRHHHAIPTLEQVEERWQRGKRRKQVGPG